MILDIDCVTPDHLIVHLPTEVLELLPRVLQRLLLYVVRGRVGQQLMQGDDVSRNLKHQKLKLQCFLLQIIHLVHWISEEHFQRVPLATWLPFQTS